MWSAVKRTKTFYFIIQLMTIIIITYRPSSPGAAHSRSRTIPRRHAPQLLESVPPRRRILAGIAPRTLHQRHHAIIQRQIPDETRQRGTRHDFLVHGRRDSGIVSRGKDLDFIEAARIRRVSESGRSARFNEAGARRGRDDNVNVAEAGREEGREGVEGEAGAGVVEDDVDEVVADVAFLARRVFARVVAIGHQRRDVEDHFRDFVVPDDGVGAVRVVGAVQALGVEGCAAEALDVAEPGDEFFVVEGAGDVVEDDVFGCLGFADVDDAGFVGVKS